MFVGHAFLAFALGAGLASLAGYRDDVVLAVGLVAGVSAVVPDLDLLVGTLAYASTLGSPAAVSWEHLWAVSNTVHRGVSHTLAGGGAGAVLVTTATTGWRAWHGRSWRALSVAVIAGVAAVAALVALAIGAGGAEIVSVALVSLGAVVLGTVVAPQTALSPRAVLAGALVGFLSHPFGDVFMAAPPDLFYPLDVAFLTHPIELAADPTLNLLGITLIELGVVWAGVLAATRITDHRVREAVAPRVVVGLAYPALMVFVPRPTMVDAHWLGVTIVPFAGVGLLPRSRSRSPTRNDAFRVVVTGLVTLTVAAGAYGVAYLAGVVP